MKRMVQTGVLLAAVVLSALATLGLAQNAKGESHALIVGVRDYQHADLALLRYTENDAEELAKVLDKPGSPFHKRVRVLTCTRGEKNSADRPTAANIEKALKELTQGKSRHDTILLALAGHGLELQVKDPTGKGDTKTYPFFCPQNAQLNDTDYKTGKSPTLVNLRDLMNTMGGSGAGGRLVLIDACRKELKERGVTRTLTTNKELVPEKVAVLFGCKSGEVAFESPKLKHGVFFHFVLEGLRGKARNEDGDVSWNDLTAYVTRSVKRNVEGIVGDGATQEPHLMAVQVGEHTLLPPGVFARVAPPVKKEDTPARKDDKVAGKEIENSIGMKLVYVPAGKFTMGSPYGEADRSPNETEHEVEITKGFYMGMYEVTQGEYEKVMGKNPSWFSTTGDGKDKVKGMDTTRFPVERVSWEDAQDFLDKLNARAEEKKKGRKYRLPSEAEWEYTARRGHLSNRKESDPFSFGKSLSSTQANFNGDSPYGGAEKGPNLGRTCKVGSYAANGLGIHDMHGNVWEWCSDRYGGYYYSNSPKRDPGGPSNTSDWVTRGGCWLNDGQYCRSASRNSSAPGSRLRGVGFRVAAVASGGE